MQLLELGRTTPRKTNEKLHRDDPDGVYRCVERLRGRDVEFPTFYKRGPRITSTEWMLGWRGETMRETTYFRVEFVREIEEGDPL